MSEIVIVLLALSHFVLLLRVERQRRALRAAGEALQALTNGKAFYYTGSFSKTEKMDAQNYWMEEK